MTNNKSVIVNGRAYNRKTGLPVDGIIARSTQPSSLPDPKVAAHKTQQRGTSMADVHIKHVKRTSTLNRRHVKKPTKPPLATRTQRQPTHVSQHEAVEKFAPVKRQRISERAAPSVVHYDRPAETHPVAHRAKARQASTHAQLREKRAVPQLRPSTTILAELEPELSQLAAQKLAALEMTDAEAVIMEHSQAELAKARTPANKSSKATAPKPKQNHPTAKELKNQAITEAMSRHHTPAKSQVKSKKPRKRHISWAQRASAGLAVMLLGGYLTYLSMPNISLRVAAVQAGIDAKYPSYSPGGYAINGPIKFADNQVKITYAYADGSRKFTLTQEKSNWNTSSVKEFFTSKSPNPTTTNVDGITVYSSDSGAAWVNGGILYQINGNANLSNEQIRQIASGL